MKQRKPLIFMLTLMLLFTAGLPVRAAENAAVQTPIPASAVTPSWINTERIDLGLSFSGSQANCSAMVIGKTGTARITATVTLQRKNTNGAYTTVKTWSGLSANGAVLTFSDSYSVTKGYNYRLTINATVYKDSIGENVSSYVEKNFS